jgi:hypothetical protein
MVCTGYSGPLGDRVEASDSELTRLSQVEINGKVGAVSKSAKGIRFSGESRPGASLRWEIS